MSKIAWKATTIPTPRISNQKTYPHLDYIGEHILPGELGRFAVILSFTSALLSAFAYSRFWDKAENSAWRKLARASYTLHAISVFTVVGTLFFMMLNHYFEYDYVWSHTSLELESRYMFSSFWEGQEGSFLLWMFWHAVLGFILMRTSKKWESGTMLVLTLVQGFLASMLMGLYLGDTQIGISPFNLIRELPEYVGLPWTMNDNYLALIPEFQDGRGLNPLLQNYWMTIHPPTLFLGFASTIIPFAFAIAGLLKNDHKGWIKPVLPWAFFSVGILGIGILMGGAWAYEALSFGGFWAWDPVENASLVPWLMMVGAAHVLLIQRNRGGSQHSAYILTLLSFLLILYSTFLTRSGILGDTSVHSFVDLGMSGQLLIYLLSFVVIAFGLYAYRFKSIKSESQEDQMSSREFWMFIGSMVLLLSSLQITFSTSTPVINALIGPDSWIPLLSQELSVPIDPVAHYNRWQLPFAIITAFLVAFGQLLNYRATASEIFWKRVGFSVAVSTVLTVIITLGMGFTNPLYIILLFTSSWAIVANADFWLRIGKRSKLFAGSSIAHVGFGLILLGTLISQGKQQVISENETYIAEDFPANENLLINKADTVGLGEYQVEWFDEYRANGNVYFPLRFWEPGSNDVSFVLEPFIQLNERMGQVSEPSTKHYLHKDVYTHLTYFDARDSSERYSPWQREQEFPMQPNRQEILYRQFMVKLDSVEVFQIDTIDGMVQGAKIGAALSVKTMDGMVYQAMPTYSLDVVGESREDAIIEELGLKFRFERADAEAKEIVMKTWLEKESEDDFIIIKAIVFPWINLLWVGCILMGLGTFVAVYQRVRTRN